MYIIFYVLVILYKDYNRKTITKTIYNKKYVNKYFKNKIFLYLCFYEKKQFIYQCKSYNKQS